MLTTPSAGSKAPAMARARSPWQDAVAAAGKLGKALLGEAGDVALRAAAGEPRRVVRHLLDPATGLAVREVLDRERLGTLARTFRDEASELALATAWRAATVPGVRQALDPDVRALVAEVTALLRQAALTPVDPDTVDRDGTALIQALAPPVDALMRGYFRFEVEGLDRVPRGPALLVSNHEAGTSFVQVLGMGARFYLERGLEERIVGLMHDRLFQVPLLANLLGHLGAVRASHEAADAAFTRGWKVYVAPGGNLDAFRPYAERHVVKLGGRRGWIRLARRNRVPVVPVVFIGGQETFFVLDDGQYLAQNLGLKKRFRIDTLPLWLGLPFGVGLGPVFHVPLPAKCKVRFLDPVAIGDPEPGETDAAFESRMYDEVLSVMQAAMDEMAAERSLPLLG